MAEETGDGQEKTEDPSQRRIEKAAEDGQILTSKEMFVFTGLFGGLLLMLGVPAVIKPALARWSEMFRFDKNVDLNVLSINRMLDVGEITIIVALVVGVPLMIVVLLTQFAVGGGSNFAPKALHFKGNRINPLKGLKRMVSMKALVELGKSVLKVVSLFGVATFILHLYADKLLQLPFRALEQAVSSSAVTFPVLLGGMLLMLAIIALLDFLWQKYSHTKQLKMSKQEVKDEFKQTEGSPEVKAKIRRMQMENSTSAARQQAALNDVSSATAVITNPTHFAVALKYEVGTPDAPKVLAMGRGRIAEMIISRAKDSKLPSFKINFLREHYFLAVK